MAIREIAAFGKALRNYREGYEHTDTKAHNLVTATRDLLALIGGTVDPPKEVNFAMTAVDHTWAIGHTYHGKSAYEAAIRAAAEEIAEWADPQRDATTSDTDFSALVTAKVNAAAE